MQYSENQIERRKFNKNRRIQQYIEFEMIGKHKKWKNKNSSGLQQKL